MKTKLLLCCLVLTLSISGSYAQNLLTFAFEGRFVSGVGVPNLTPSNFNDAGITSSTIGRTGLGVSAFGGEAMNCNGISVGTTQPVLTSYIEFRVTPVAGKIINITGVEIAQIRSNGTGATFTALRSSADNFTSNLGGVVNFANTTGNTFMVATYSFTMSNVSTAVTFRLYPFGGIQTFGTWGPGGRTGNDVIVFGSTGDAVLPIDLVKFTAEKFKEKVKISWLTATEINNEKFIIEKSRDAKNYEVFAEIQGAGNSKELNSYELMDDAPYSGTSYYRLTQVGFDGKGSSFEPVAVDVKGRALSMEIMARGEELGAGSSELGAGSGSREQGVLNWKIYAPEEALATISVSDLNGRIIFTEKIQLNEGYQQYTMPSTNFTDQLVVVSLLSNGEVVRKKVLSSKF